MYSTRTSAVSARTIFELVKETFKILLILANYSSTHAFSQMFFGEMKHWFKKTSEIIAL